MDVSGFRWKKRYSFLQVTLHLSDHTPVLVGSELSNNTTWCNGYKQEAKSSLHITADMLQRVHQK